MAMCYGRPEQPAQEADNEGGGEARHADALEDGGSA